MNISQEELVSIVTKIVIEKMQQDNDILIPIGVSNRHIHLSREDLDFLFGQGYELTKIYVVRENSRVRQLYKSG